MRVLFLFLLLTQCDWAVFTQQSTAPDLSNLLIYADFEQKEPLSARGGELAMGGYQEKAALPVKYSNSNKDWPRLPVLLAAEPGLVTQHIGFEYEIPTGNGWAGVSLTVRGLPRQDGKQVAEDLSAYHYLRFKVAVAGAKTLRVDLISEDNGVKTDVAPQFTVNLKDEKYAVFRLPLKNFGQPAWAKTRVNVMDVLKQLTAVQFTITEVGAKGTVQLDNIVFEKESKK